MKKIGLFILSLFTVFLVGSFTHGNSEYEYKNLDINANILEDGTINVKENYIANFFVNKHGIIRNIPLNYNIDGTKFHIDISDINVEGKTFTTNLNNGQREIKIGDANKTVIGEQTYPISYTTYGLIKNFSGMGYSELYWNLVGNSFDTSINKVRAVIHLPKIYTGFTNDDFLITVGGTTTTVESFQGKISRAQGDKIVITYGKGLSAFQGITLAVKFPNDYFNFDDKKQNGLIGNAQENTDYEDINLNINMNNTDNDEKEEIYNTNNKEVKVDNSEKKSSNNTSKNVTPKRSLVGNPEYEYTNLDITANILIDGTMDVKEDFTANFFVQRHGMIRGIPLNYSVLGNNFHIEVSDINVLGKKFTKSKSNGNIEIKIGDVNETIVGEQDYPITYKTYGLIRNYSGMGYAELYWNLVGNDFDTNINNVRADIYLPKTYTGFTADDFLITADGITNTVKDFGGKIERKEGDKITIIYDKGLSAFQGITLSIRFPNDYFEFDHKRQTKLTGNAKQSLSQIFGSFLSVIVSIGIFILVIILRIKNIGDKFGFFKDYKNKIDKKSGALRGKFADKFPVIVQYNPPQGINSAEAGLLLHRGAKAKDILSLIYKRATEGLITISTEKTEGSIFSSSKDIIIISKNRDIPGDLPGYEQDFFRSLVHGEKNKIEKSTNLYNKLGLSSLESYGKKKGWLTGNRFKSGVIVILFIGVYFLFDFLSETFQGLSDIFFLLFIFLCIYLSNIPKLKETEEGAKLISHLLGYREFLAMCDENKLRLFLEQDPLYFDKILPYAVAFGLDTELIKKIEPLMQEMNIKSTWYNGNLNSMYLMNDIISSVAERSIPHYSSSGGFSGGSSFGGGFSFGGGGGGGGGRSW